MNIRFIDQHRKQALVMLLMKNCNITQRHSAFLSFPCLYVAQHVFKISELKSLYTKCSSLSRDRTVSEARELLT